MKSETFSEKCARQWRATIGEGTPEDAELDALDKADIDRALGRPDAGRDMVDEAMQIIEGPRGPKSAGAVIDQALEIMEMPGRATVGPSKKKRADTEPKPEDDEMVKKAIEIINQ